MQTLIVLLILAAAVYIGWKSKTPEGWDVKKGFAALAALALAAWAAMTDWLSALP
jgi:hypothetical protein